MVKQVSLYQKFTISELTERPKAKQDSRIFSVGEFLKLLTGENNGKIDQWQLNKLRIDTQNPLMKNMFFGSRVCRSQN